MEHHSNDLPWRKVAEVVHLQLGADGLIDEAHLREMLRVHGQRVGLLAVAGASNVTGVINPIHKFARWAHEAGARILVDAAQLAPHRPINMRPADDPAHLDFVVFSAHKMYAPFGVGVLVGPAAVFASGDPYEVGGGTVDSVSPDRVSWTGLPDREEAGTPCVVGAVALGAAIKVIEEIGWNRLERHEATLTRQALTRLSRVPGLVIYGNADPSRASERLGVISFNLDGVSHALVAAILSHEWGIGTRSGCFCAQTYVRHLLKTSEADALEVERRIAAGDRSHVPGAVRISIAAYNTPRDIETLGCALDAIAAGRVRGEYLLDRATGAFHPTGMSHDFSDYFSN
jgi:selenocysteine lyase/cysteine desulfurase